MRSRLDPTPLKEQRIQIAIDSGQKRKVFEAAAARGQSASQFIREVVISATSGVDRGAA